MVTPHTPPRQIPGVDVSVMPSQHVGADFEISVALLRAPGSSEAASYPVLYISDATVYFTLACDVIRLMQLSEELPELLAVGIGYPISDFYTDAEARE